jgi:acetyl esterase/lipase
MVTSSSDAGPRPAAGAGQARVADLLLRGRTGPLRVRVHWPARPVRDPASAVLVLFPDGESEDEACRALGARTGAVVLAASPTPTPGSPAPGIVTVGDAITVTQWAADHAAELDADPGRLLVGGEGAGAALAAAVAGHARDEGWPPVTLVPIGPAPASASGSNPGSASGSDRRSAKPPGPVAGARPVAEAADPSPATRPGSDRR